MNYMWVPFAVLLIGISCAGYSMYFGNIILGLLGTALIIAGWTLPTMKHPWER